MAETAINKAKETITCSLPKDVPLRTSIKLGQTKNTKSLKTNSHYRAAFLAIYPEYTKHSSDLVLHPAIPPFIAKQSPKLFSNAELNSVTNLRGICKLDNNSVHLPIIRAWVRFLLAHNRPTRKEIIDQAQKIDKLWGAKFYPPIYETDLTK